MNGFGFWGGVLLIGFVLANPALAYIGPGAGLSAIGTVVAVIGAFILLVVGFVWYPIKRLLRGRKAGAERASETERINESEPAADAGGHKAANPES